MSDRTIFLSNSYNAYIDNPPHSGLIGLACESGLVWDNLKYDLANKFEGIDKTIEFVADACGALGSGTITYHTYDR